MGVKCLASFTKTCSWPPLAERSDFEMATDLMLPNLRKPPELVVLERMKLALLPSGGTYFKPTTISPRYVAISSKGSLWNGEKKETFR